jgi:hypothetical protein
MTLLVTIGVVLGVLVALVALVLVTWLRLEGRVGEGAVRVGVRWLALALAVDIGRRTIEVRLFGRVLSRRPMGGDDPPRPKRERARAARRVLPGVWLGRFDRAWRFYRGQLAYLARGTRLDRLDGSVRIATPDPALTGILYGAACAVVLPLAGRLPAASLDLEPDFLEEWPSGHGALELRVRLATLALIGWRVFRHERSERGATTTRAVEEGRRHHGTE